ncbi:hypothetical protein [Homoserinibacter sp. GY 40078]|uniref:hypothetical protein n=1 Tax=Homoserinibacter sp. GY 40078 TaxID=2603275 RepID=UPI0011CBC61F|nr:hypothetical protein [Homoserinibacter sp. GY 40078]TXK17245.1 hypothetical protein FVQ89_10340 [Homoserinibacter sp. GY 40078]
MTAAPPRLRAFAWRFAVAAVGVGIAAAIVLALAGVSTTGDGPELFVSLIPAVLIIGIGMGIPPALIGLLALSFAIRPPRSPRRETIAVVVGVVIGSFASPTFFYPVLPAIAVAVAVGIALVLSVVAALLVRAVWRAAGRRE